MSSFSTKTAEITGYTVSESINSYTIYNNSDRSGLDLSEAYFAGYCDYLDLSETCFVGYCDIILVGSVLLIFSVFCVVFIFLRPVFRVSNVASFYRLSILGWAFGFL